MYSVDTGDDIEIDLVTWMELGREVGPDWSDDDIEQAWHEFQDFVRRKQLH